MIPFYLDFNATTPVHPVVLEAMLPFFGPAFGNPSSAHPYGFRLRSAMETARAKVAALIGAQEDEIVFTSPSPHRTCDEKSGDEPPAGCMDSAGQWRGTRSRHRLRSKPALLFAGCSAHLWRGPIHGTSATRLTKNCGSLRYRRPPAAIGGGKAASAERHN
jgi:hypothetical protein